MPKSGQWQTGLGALSYSVGNKPDDSKEAAKFMKNKYAQNLFPRLCRAQNPGTRLQAKFAAGLSHMRFGKSPGTMNPI